MAIMMRGAEKVMCCEKSRADTQAAVIADDARPRRLPSVAKVTTGTTDVHTSRTGEKSGAAVMI